MKENINSQSYWDKRWTETPMLSRKLENVICGLVKEKCSVLDIGCGSGRILRSLKKDLGCEVFGIDISQVAINILKRYGIKGLAMNVEDFSLKSPYDVIILSHTLEHISSDKELVLKVASITKKYAIIAVPNDCMEDEPEHVRKYNKESLTSLVSKHFKQIEDHSVGVHLVLKCYV